MAFSRYNKTSRLAMGHHYGTQRSMWPLYKAAQEGRLSTSEYVTKEGDRLDQLAGKYYGNGRYWWVIAAASGIGWGIQVPPGIVLTIPDNISQVEGLVG
tara:strand:+ start:5421 stop:5717 length:297 start_codon:yes stop_codon:yes gene_type:complete